MSFGFTMARSRPACTAWYRKTEFTTSRAGFERPKLTFETPRQMKTPGFSALMRRMPSSVSSALRRYSSPPVASVKVSGSKTRLSGGTPYSFATATVRRATSALRSAVCAIPFSSMVMATTAAPYRRTSGSTFFTRSPDFSRLTEFTMQRPGCTLSAASTTSASVESIMSGASTDCASSFTSVRICAASSSRSFIATHTSSTCAPPSTWSRAMRSTPA